MVSVLEKCKIILLTSSGWVHNHALKLIRYIAISSSTYVIVILVVSVLEKCKIILLTSTGWVHNQCIKTDKIYCNQ